MNHNAHRCNAACLRNHKRTRPQAEPLKRLDVTWREVVEILAATAVWSLLLVALFFWVAVAAVQS